MALAPPVLPQSQNPNSSPATPHVPWGEFLDGFDWRQGEHVTLIGPTGQGKTTLALRLLPLRRWKVLLANKPRDDTMQGAVDAGYRLTRKWVGKTGGPAQVLWPKATGIRSARVAQKEEFQRALDAMYRTGGWCIYADEAHWLCHFLGLKDDMVTLWTQGRSSGISLMAGTQRPAFVPLYAYDMATHLFFWRDNDERNLARIGGLGGMAAGPVRDAVSALDKHQTLYVNTRDGQIVTTRVEV